MLGTTNAQDRLLISDLPHHLRFSSSPPGDSSQHLIASASSSGCSHSQCSSVSVVHSHYLKSSASSGDSQVLKSSAAASVCSQDLISFASAGHSHFLKSSASEELPPDFSSHVHFTQIQSSGFSSFCMCIHVQINGSLHHQSQFADHRSLSIHYLILNTYMFSFSNFQLWRSYSLILNFLF